MYCRENNQKPKKSHRRNTPSFSSSLLDEICRSIDPVPDPKPPQTSSFSKVEKWMENDKTIFRRRPRYCENAVFPTSSDADQLYSNRPKPVRTGRRDDRQLKDCYLFDEYEEHERNRDDLIKSKSPATKIYANLKKIKQPISPGARLSSFFSSIFSGLNRKKSRDAGRNDRKPAAPSPAKMFTRCSTKCLDTTDDGIEKTARFDRACVAVDRDAMPRGQRSVLGGGRPPLPPTTFRNRKMKFSDFDREDEEEEDAVSESSSDLFELDHLSMFGVKDRFCEELPVYETTYFDKNCRLFR